MSETLCETPVAPQVLSDGFDTVCSMTTPDVVATARPAGRWTDVPAAPRVRQVPASRGRAWARSGLLAALAIVQAAAAPVVLGLGAFSAVTSAQGWVQVRASTLLAALVGVGLITWVFTSMSRRRLRERDLAAALAAALLLAAVGQLAVADPGLAGLAVGLMLAGVLAAPARWLLRERDPATRRFSAVAVDAVLATATVPVPPARVLAAWVAATGQSHQTAVRLGQLDELVAAAEHRQTQGDSGARVRATDLPGVPAMVISREDAGGGSEPTRY